MWNKISLRRLLFPYSYHARENYTTYFMGTIYLITPKKRRNPLNFRQKTWIYLK